MRLFAVFVFSVYRGSTIEPRDVPRDVAGEKPSRERLAVRSYEYSDVRVCIFSRESFVI